MNETDQTVQSFRDKWTNNPGLAFAETLREGSDIFEWILTRNGLSSADELRAWLSSRRRVLDAGCGNGRVTALLHRYSPPGCHVTAIDLSAADVAAENLAPLDNVTVATKDLLGNLSDLGLFDLIYCQEVLHHTADPKAAFLNLCGRLAPAGEIAIYVYKVKAPLREHADDYIRERVAGLSYEDALEVMRGITELGRALADVPGTVAMPRIDVLGIAAGDYTVQRFIYHFFLKCFWNPALSRADNLAINYDWYHPTLCSRHTLAEVEAWFVEADLAIVHRCVDYYGITVRGIRQ